MVARYSTQIHIQRSSIWGSSNYAKTSLPLPSKRKKKITLPTVLSLITRQSYHTYPTQRTPRSINQPNNPSSHQNLNPLPTPTSHQIKPLFISPSLPLSLSPSLPLSPYLASPQPQSPSCATHLQHESKPA